MSNYDETVFYRSRQRIRAAKNGALLEAAQSMREEIDNRIFERSRRADGGAIGQGTHHKDGTVGTNYEKKYAKTRKREGLQIGFIDFQRKGNLRKALKAIRTASGSIKIVIDGNSAEIAARLDKMKGKTFSPTKSEIALAKKKFRDAIRQRL